MLKEDRKKAFNAAKSAVKAYTKDPSDKNAASVRSAWEVVNDIQATLIWRQQAEEGSAKVALKRAADNKTPINQ